MIDTHKNLFRYEIENDFHYVNPTSLQMVRISLIDKKLDQQNNGKDIILFDVYFGKLFNFNIFIMI